jgi:hypothetical protein
MHKISGAIFIALSLSVTCCAAGESAAAAGPKSDVALGKPRAMVGAYYFDGWSGQTDQMHLTKLLQTEFADRKPVWGWWDNTVEIMQQQIDYAAQYGLAFWAFDWYYPGPNKVCPCNNALSLYLKTPNRERLGFCVMATNHEPYRIGPKQWDDCCRIWIDMFRQSTYVRLDGQPLLIFFDPDDLQREFGGVEGVRKAFESLRAKAKQAGLPGVAIAACSSPGGHPELVQSGYSLLTGYAFYHGFLNGAGRKPFRELIELNRGYFDGFAKTAPLPFAPVITTGFDRRPWEQGAYPPERMSSWYPDRTPQLVEEFVRMGVRWLDEHPDKAAKQRLLLLYAWNENGEGGYLTPTVAEGTEYLKAVQRAICSPR